MKNWSCQRHDGEKPNPSRVQNKRFHSGQKILHAIYEALDEIISCPH